MVVHHPYRYPHTVSDDIVKAVNDYYIPHRQQNVQIVRWIPDPDGHSLLQVRLIDEAGKKKTVFLDVFKLRGTTSPQDVDVCELYVTDRENEENMIKVIMEVG